MKTASKLLAMASATLMSFATPSVAQTDDLGPDQVGREGVFQSLEGKRVVVVPISTGTDLVESWLLLMRRQAEQYGYELDVRDPNWSTENGIRAITAAIGEKPDLLVVQNPDIQVYARLLQRAQSEGLPVLQINMPSLTQTDSYVGVDWVSMGERKGQALVDACTDGSGPSNKVAFVQGVVTGAANIYMKRGLYSVLQEHPELELVSEQAGNYDAERIRGIMDTVLQQHPDLCGAVGVWDSGDVGIGAALEAAGLTGEVFVATSGAGSAASACENINRGMFSLVVSYNSPLQGHLINQRIVELLQSDGVADQSVASFTPLHDITAENMTSASCWTMDQL